MRLLWVHQDIDAPAATLWTLLADCHHWPRWGPTVRHATLDSAELDLGATGTVTTLGGIRLPFEVTAFEQGARWGWRVASIGATDHTVQPIDSQTCRVGFGVPWPAAPYLAVCKLALRRLDHLATADEEDA